MADTKISVTEICMQLEIDKLKSDLKEAQDEIEDLKELLELLREEVTRGE